MLKVIIHGYFGQMGQVISNLIINEEDIKLVAGIDKKTKSYKYDLNIYKCIFDFEGESDVIIDFSSPSALDKLLKYAITNNIALVIGTTGYEEKEIKKLKEAAEKIPVFYSANMSLGINLLLSLVSKTATILGKDFDIEIIEKHHNKKVDAPSGTAYMIANKINEEFENNLVYTFGRNTKTNKRSPKEIGIHAIRGGTIVGEHSVIFAGLDEIIEIKHSAMSKNVFGKGALQAARFIATQDNGLYNMNDLINKSKNI
ncbi:MAG: 4-hydroxy-tetrahydrodipicolinate reductase [Tissierellia bacterium]|nr:4-hydroxy-tetrahydrodipicolinate reductase [Tissierellia bacterium]